MDPVAFDAVEMVDAPWDSGTYGFLDADIDAAPRPGVELQPIEKRPSVDIFEFFRPSVQSTMGHPGRPSTQRASFGRVSIEVAPMSTGGPSTLTFLSDESGIRTDLTIIQSMDLLLAHKHKSTKGSNGGTVAWLNIENPTEFDIRILWQYMNIHEVTRDDILKIHIREKWEYFPDYLFMIIHDVFPDRSSSIVEFAPIKMLLYKNILITIHPSRRTRLYDLMNRLKNDMKILPSPGWCLSAILHLNADNFQKHTTLLSIDVDAIDSCILTLRDSTNARELLIRLRNAHLLSSVMFHMILAKEKTIKSLCRGNRRFIMENVQFYLRSLYHRIANMKSSLQILKEMLNTSETNFLTASSIRQISEANRAGITVKILTSIGTIYMPSGLVAALFGMNVPVPAQHVNNLNAFYIICSCVALISIVLYVFFKAKGFM